MKQSLKHAALAVVLAAGSAGVALALDAPTRMDQATRLQVVGGEDFVTCWTTITVYNPVECPVECGGSSYNPYAQYFDGVHRNVVLVNMSSGPVCTSACPNYFRVTTKACQQGPGDGPVQ
jgi:hypothetical protein